MSLLSIHKIYKVIEMAELIYGSRGSGRTKQPETFIDKLSYYLEDFNITKRCSINVLKKYIDELSKEEKAEVIALMWLGRSTSGEQPEDLANLVKQVVELIPQNYATSYILERPLLAKYLAKYLRNGLQKLNILTSASS
jgi:Cdc6-like AAA superfamily ATPase